MQNNLKQVSCDPDCGFMIRSHDDQEIREMTIKHAKSAHNKDVSEKDVDAMMQTVKTG